MKLIAARILVLFLLIACEEEQTTFLIEPPPETVEQNETVASEPSSVSAPNAKSEAEKEKVADSGEKNKKDDDAVSNQPGKVDKFQASIECRASDELADKKWTKCKIDAAKGFGIINYEIDEHSSPLCFEKGNIRVSLSGKQIRVRKGCHAIVHYNAAKIIRPSLEGQSLMDSMQAFGLDDIILPRRLKQGEVVEMSESSAELTLNSDGIGVKGGGSHAPSQINFDPIEEKFESVSFDIPNNSLFVTVSVSRMVARESTGERGVILLLDEKNEIVRRKHMRWGKKAKEKDLHEKRVKINTAGAVKALIVPLDYRKVELEGRTDSSDFYVKNLKFVKYES